MSKVKITLEVTKNGYSRKLEYNGKVYKEKSIKTNTGSEGITPSICTNEDLPDYIIDNLNRPEELMRCINLYD